MPISAPIPVKRPPSENPIAEPADAPMAAPPAKLKYNIEVLTIDLHTSPNSDPKSPDTVGAPKVLDWVIP